MLCDWEEEFEGCIYIITRQRIVYLEIGAFDIAFMDRSVSITFDQY